MSRADPLHHTGPYTGPCTCHCTIPLLPPGAQREGGGGNGLGHALPNLELRLGKAQVGTGVEGAKPGSRGM
eukprot:921362-Rhodomonas_salina.1